jgi:hypothetical protein
VSREVAQVADLVNDEPVVVLAAKIRRNLTLAS